MKTLKFVLPVLCLLLLFSCSKEEVLKVDDELTAETRRDGGRDCIPTFEDGQIDDLFGADIGDQGTFEQNSFPCPELSEIPDCCPEKSVSRFQVNGPNNPLPFPTACNFTLAAGQQQIIYNRIMLAANTISVRCDDTRFSMSPVNFDVFFVVGQNCTIPAPCTGPVETPCDCFDDFPNDPYWNACQSYNIFVDVTYAYTGDCNGFTNG